MLYIYTILIIMMTLTFVPILSLEFFVLIMVYPICFLSLKCSTTYSLSFLIPKPREEKWVGDEARRHVGVEKKQQIG